MKPHALWTTFVASCALGTTLIALGLAGATARAQTANCDFAQGDVDLFIHLRFEDFEDCPAGSGLPCTQDAEEDDMVGWGISLAAGPGTTGDTATTDADGEAHWTGNGAFLNTCVHHGQHTITLSVPSPSPYDPEANFPNNLTFNFTINPTDAQGQNIERFFLTVYFGCSCDDDGDACTIDSCRNGLCPYVAADYDPTKAEVCNDKDDDCDGDIDEGLPPSAPECTNASVIGCSDKTREGFMTWDEFPLIAACGGSWTTPGLDGDPTCNHVAGNHVTTGANCSAADLCPTGWHICYGPDDVAQRLGGGDCTDAVDPYYPNFGSGVVAAEVSVPPGGAFFASAARSSGGTCDEGVNGTATSAGIFGCGNMGLASDDCGFFDRAAGGLCGGLRDSEPTAADDPATDYGYATSGEWAWSCGPTAGNERAQLRKALADRQGGVLCCKDTDPSLAEVCDGIDNDGDGDTDEFAFGGGPTTEAGGTCQSGGQCGTLACTADGGWACNDLHACADVTCDGVDDDDDGDTDDDYVETPTSCGTGVCAATGVRRCVGGDEEDTCVIGAKAENSDTTCDGRDGDCDGSTDEDFVATATTCGVGACAATGTTTCSGNVPGDTCTAGDPLAADDDSCDGIDDDCDGTDDEDVPSTATTCGVGACASTGTSSCVDGALADSCEAGDPAANDATCNDVDDDCDGSTDEDFVDEETTCGVGLCAGNTGTRSCVGGTVSDSCDPLEGAVTETCDGADDDCDGSTDEGFDVGEACDGDDADSCERGTLACAGGEAVCEETGDGEVETCDGQDNDCDGQTDEGLADAGCTDRDEDEIPDALDNCVDTPNTDQVDSDDDGAGDACDLLAQGGACQSGGNDLGLAGLALALAWVVGRARR